MIWDEFKFAFHMEQINVIYKLDFELKHNWLTYKVPISQTLSPWLCSQQPEKLAPTRDKFTNKPRKCSLHTIEGCQRGNGIDQKKKQKTNILAFNNSSATVQTDGWKMLAQQKQTTTIQPFRSTTILYLTDANDLFISQFIMHNSIINIEKFLCSIERLSLVSCVVLVFKCHAFY